MLAHHRLTYPHYRRVCTDATFASVNPRVCSAYGLVLNRPLDAERTLMLLMNESALRSAASLCCSACIRRVALLLGMHPPRSRLQWLSH